MTEDNERSATAIALTRRRVVTTVAHTAWAAPVIVAATAAPAFAASGAAVITTLAPSFLLLGDRVRIVTILSNRGTAPPSSMTVVVVVTPVSGALVDQDPVVQDPDFVFTSRQGAPGGPQTLTFTKVEPQIPANGQARLTFDVNHRPGAGNLRVADVNVTPVVPPPSSAAGASNRYTSTEPA